MKILKIRTKNLNSLKGLNQIDFTKTPFSDTGIFAITGETGAGKTTILDALTLGLYGKTSRKHENEVMTYGTADCYAEVEFEVKEAKYRAKWSRRRSRNKIGGRLQSASHEIAALPSGKFLCRSTTRLVRLKIEEIIGLGYEQFKRSVMLAQGDFAAFLEAKEKEKSELLERITGTEVYTNISKAAFERCKIEKEKLERLQLKLASLQILSKEEEADLIRILGEKKAANKQLKQTIAELRTQKQWLLDVKKHEEQLIVFKSGLEKLEEIKIAFVPKQERLALHLRAVPHQKALAKLAFLNTEIQKLNGRLEKNQATIDRLKIDIQEKTTTHKQAQTAWEIIESQRESKEKLFEAIIKLDTQIQAEVKPIYNKINKLDGNKRKLKQDEKALKEQKRQLEQLGITIQNLEKWLEQNAIDNQIQQELSDIQQLKKEETKATKEGKELDKVLKRKIKEHHQTEQKLEKVTKETKTVEQELKQLKQEFDNSPAIFPTGNRRGDLDKFHEQIEARKKEKEQLALFLGDLKMQEVHQKELEKVMNELGDYDDELRINRQKIEQLKTDGTNAESIYQDKSKIYELELRIKNYEQERVQLKEGEPCPLCLSKDHPFHTHGYKPQISAAKKAKDLAEKRVKKLKVAQAKVEERMVAIQTNIQNLEAKQNDYETEINNFEESAVYQPEIIKNLYYQGGKVALEQKIEEHKDRLNRMTLLFSRLKNVVRKIEHKNEEFSNLQISVTGLREREIGLKNDKSRLENDLNDTLKIRTDAVASLGNLLTKYQLLYSDNRLVTKLESRKTIYQENTDKLQRHLQEKELTAQQIKTLFVHIEEQKTTIGAEETEIQLLERALEKLKENRIEQFGNRNPEIARRDFRRTLAQKEQALKNSERTLQTNKTQLSNTLALLKENQHRLSENQTEQQNHQLVLENALKTDGFEGIKDLQQALLSKEAANTIKEAQKRIENELLKQKTTIEATEKELFVLQENPKTTENIDTINNALEEKTAHQTTLSEQIGGIRQRLNDNAAQKIIAKDQLIIIEMQKKEYNRWAILNDLIGQADGKKFRAFAQGLTLQKLVHLANQHLQNLSGRYHIDKKKGHDLELEIVDHFQGGNARSMSTLSGGECFLASLALALGLSALAGRDTQIRSLFIDEGFGTLDDQTLDIAIQTLENLQSQGKTIGVISHVQELKERITTQVQVSRIGQGVSKVAIRG